MVHNSDSKKVTDIGRLTMMKGIIGQIFRVPVNIGGGTYIVFMTKRREFSSKSVPF